MYRLSNTVIGLLNFLTLLASLPLIGAGLWMARSTTTCEHFLQTPLLVLGFLILILSLAGFIGACFNVVWALWVYLFVMLFIIVALIGLTVFGVVVTNPGGGVAVAGRVYKEYRLQNYHPWLRNKVRDDHKYWLTVRACLFNSKTCAKVASWTPADYLQKDLSPIQSGCCKPPTACVYNTATTAQQDPDCYKWNNAANVLCYDCDSCRAGVLETVRRDWHKLTILNVAMVVVLIVIYTIGCCAYQNAKRYEYGYHYRPHWMSKSRPGWDYYWWRWWNGR